MSEFYNSCEGINIWINLLISVIVSPVLLVIKILWDRCNKKRQESIVMNNKLLLEKISLKLKNFYWPLYIRLVKNYTIWIKFCENSEMNILIRDKEKKDNIYTCQYIDPETTIKCKTHIYCNSDSNYCMEHIDIQNSEPAKDKMNIYFKNLLIENYKEINNLIIQYIYIAEPNSSLGKILIYYMKFALIMIGLLENDKQINLKKYNFKYPHSLLPMIEKKLFKLQKNYNNLLSNFYYSKKQI